MRAHEFILEQGSRNRGITLRQMNRAKHDYKRRKASLDRRKRLVRVMYTNPAKEHERIDLEKSRLELEQQKAELAATKANTQADLPMAISTMAKAGSEAEHQRRSKLSNMAKSEMRRRKT
jgi:hypothetical protein